MNNPVFIGMFRTCLMAMIVLLFSCSQQNDKPDVSRIKVDVQIEAFEKDFFSIDTNQIPASLQKIHAAHPSFFPTFMMNVLETDLKDSSTGFQMVKSFLYYHSFLFDSIRKKYPDYKWLKRDLDDNLRYVKHYFPQYAIPKIVTFIGPLNAPGIVVLEKGIGVGLHQFAGKDASIYKAQEIIGMYPLYISRRFDKEYMVPGVMRGVISSIYPDSSMGRPLIEQMIEKGKEWYLLDHFLPDAHDSLITGFTGAQVAWCEKNEGHIWNTVASNEDIYTIDPTTVQNYIGPGPFTQGMPQEYSPGNIGQWIGWRILQKFSSRNPEMTLQQVISTSASRIYNEAKYKPK
jgi:hypothetical protein